MNIFGHEFDVPLSAINIDLVEVEPLAGVIIPLIIEYAPVLEDFLQLTGYVGAPYLFIFEDSQYGALCVEYENGNCEVIAVDNEGHPLFSSPEERRAFLILATGAVA